MAWFKKFIFYGIPWNILLVFSWYTHLPWILLDIQCTAQNCCITKYVHSCNGLSSKGADETSLYCSLKKHWCTYTMYVFICVDLFLISDEMIDSTSTLVRTESVKSRQSSNTTTSNDSVSYKLHVHGGGYRPWAKRRGWLFALPAFLPSAFFFLPGSP